MLFKAKSPGSLMLLGEYAVLYGKQALTCAIDKYITVTLEPQSHSHVDIISRNFGEYHTELSKIDINPPFQFVLATLKKFQKQLPSGCRITIDSEFSDKIGFGSSAAVTVATLSAVMMWLDCSINQIQLIKYARDIVRDVQGVGSGADVAACILGGMVSFKTKPLQAEKLPFSYPLSVIYSGSKTPTKDAIQFVQNHFSSDPQLFKKICEAIHHCASQGISFVRQQQWENVGKCMTMQQHFLNALGVNTRAIAEILEKLHSQKNILGAKISGSGLGDCVVGLGMSEGLPTIPVSITNEGVCCEKI